MKKITILLVEDDFKDRKRQFSCLEAAGYEIIQSGNGQEAGDLAEKHMPKLVITDNQLPGQLGRMLIRVIKNTRPDMLCVLMSSCREDILRPIAEECGADGYVVKGEGYLQVLLEKVQTLLAGAAHTSQD